MIETSNFGELVAKNIKVGDLVSWNNWKTSDSGIETRLGVVLDVKNEIVGNRMVCLSLVMPLKGPQIPVELFTFSLKLVSSGGQKEG
jgi:hypothetical protein